MKKNWLIYITILFATLGTLLAMQYNSYQENFVAERTDLKDNMLSMISELEQEIEMIEEEISLVRSQISEYQEINLSEEEKLEFLQDYLYQQRVAAALTSKKGQGLIIILDDNVAGAQSANADSPYFNPESYIIHDKNLLYLVNELKAAGAEAIAINNQRVVANSNIRCVGTVILVNTIPLAPPYEIRALSNPEELKEKIITGNEISYLRSQNFPIKIEIAEVEVPEYRGSFKISRLSKVED